MSVGKINEFDVESGNWTLYCERVELYFTANGIKEELKLPTLILLAGDRTYELMVDLASPRKPRELTYGELTKLVRAHLQPRPSVLAERYRFRQRRQQSAESISQYIAMLKQLSRYCEFGSNLDEHLRDQFVCGVSSDLIRQKLFAEDGLTFNKATSLACILEAAERDAAAVEWSTRGNSAGAEFQNHGINVMKKGPGEHRAVQSGSGAALSLQCSACGKQGHVVAKCRYRNFVCNKCNSKGHLQRVCTKASTSRPGARPGRRENFYASVASDKDSEEEEPESIFQMSLSEFKPVSLTLMIEGKPLKMEVDTGTPASCISNLTYKKLFKNKPIEKIKTCFNSYTDERINPIVNNQTVNYKHIQKQLDLYVIKEGITTLIGRHWLSLLNIKIPKFQDTSQKEFEMLNLLNNLPSYKNLNVVLDRYKNVFGPGLGRYTGGTATLRVRPDAVPVFVRARPMPYALRERVDAELDAMLREGVIEPVDCSDWATPLVPVHKKDGGLRVCADFKASRYLVRPRGGTRAEGTSPARSSAEPATSEPQLTRRLPPVEQSASESCLSARKDTPNEPTKKPPSPLDKPSETSGDIVQIQSPPKQDSLRRWPRMSCLQAEQRQHKAERAGKHSESASKKPGTTGSLDLDVDDSINRQIREIHNETRKSARIIRDSKARLLEIQKKPALMEADIKELGERNELLLREMERFDRLTRNIQKLVGAELAQSKPTPPQTSQNQPMQYIPGTCYEPAIHHSMKMNHPTVLLAGRPDHAGGGGGLAERPRSKSEIDLTRKLSECYDMQEKLVADNADLEVKRYILYKELMTKDQKLETCRAQIKRLQGELKFMNKENGMLLEKLNKNNPEGDATAMKLCPFLQESESDRSIDDAQTLQLIEKLKNYKTSTIELEKQLGGLELEVRNVRIEMDKVKNGAGGCRGSGCNGEANVCFEQPSGPPMPPLTKICGSCPPCPAPCNPTAPQTPAEKDVERLRAQLKQTEENFKTKVTECAMLRTELLKKREELEKERCQHREAQGKLRELEMKFEGLNTHTNMLLGTKEQAFEQEVSVRALKQCYREAREEIDELRIAIKEQDDQLQDYRVKYLQAQQLVEEQRRQLEMMDMDNTRISEQINIEIQKVKLKFQEKLQELTPIPDLLKATQMKLKDAQQSQAIAEHTAEQLARELNVAREKMHIILHNATKPQEKAESRTAADEKQLAMLQQRIAQLTETNISLKQEIERLKANVIRMEEAVLANEKRLQEKMHECAQFGGELDRARDESVRAVQRANERTETIRKCMQTTVAELERQLACSRAQVSTAEKEREELQARMRCQIQRLNDNFEQAQLRIYGLQTQVQSLRRTASSTGEDNVELECACKDMFERT